MKEFNVIVDEGSGGSYMSSRERGELSAHINAVLVGVQPVAEVTVRKEYLRDAIGEIEDRGLYHFKLYRGSGHTVLAIFKHEHLANAVLYAAGLPVENEHAFRHWVAGKMYGYSEDQIAKTVLIWSLQAEPLGSR